MEPTKINLAHVAWIGRSQAFGFIAHQCSAAQAECLRAIRENEAYKILGLTWEDFCDQHVGLHRSRVEALIQNLDEFGATFFRMAQIAHVSPELYRHIAPRIEGETIEISGEQVPILPENADRIRGAVQRLRADLQKSRDASKPRKAPTVITVKRRFDACFKAFGDIIQTQPGQSPSDLRSLCDYIMDHLTRVSQSIP